MSMSKIEGPKKMTLIKKVFDKVHRADDMMRSFILVTYSNSITYKLK